MKKFYVVLAVLLVAVACCSVFANEVSFAEQTDDYKTGQAYLFMAELCKFASRSGTQNEIAVAEWLKGKFDGVLGEGASKVVNVNAAELSTANVVAKIDNPSTDKQIIVGAHFDAVASGQGASDNASGVCAMYLVMQSLAGKSLPFDVVFVAFGGEENGFVGSQNYVDAMAASEKSNTMVMFNIDSIANGDELYLMCENKPTALADFVLKQADDACKITEKPYRKGFVYGMDSYGYGYYETIQGSDHTPFRLAGVPVAFFFSGYYGGLAYKENADANKSVMNTSADTLARLESNWGGQFVSKVESVAQTIVNSVTSNDFVSVAENARDDIENLRLVYGKYPKIAVAALAVIAVVLGVLYYNKLKKRSIFGAAEIKTARVFSQPDAEDIFSFDNNGKDDADDVFKF